jgi:Flp pilus assembly pilin Flp
MRLLPKILRNLTRDEGGGEVIEYALIAGLIVVASIAPISCVGMKLLTRWNQIDSSM